MDQGNFPQAPEMTQLSGDSSLAISKDLLETPMMTISDIIESQEV